MTATVRQEADRRPLSAQASGARLTFWLCAGFAVWCLVMQAASFRSLVPPVGLVQAAVFGVIAAGVARGSRKALLAAPIAGLAVLLVSMPYIVKDLSHPGDVIDFAWTLVAVPLVLSAAVAGWRAFRGR